MNKSIVIISAALAAASCLAPSARAQTPLTVLSLEEALELFGRNSPELRLARARARASLGSARQSRAAPNPTATLTHEDLGAYTERYLNVAQRVDFLWERGSRGRRADALAASARAGLRADSSRLALEVKRAYVAAWSAAETLSALRRVDAVMEDVLADAGMRFGEGDVSGYDVRRLRVARLGVGQRLALAEVALEEAERTLGSLVAGDGTLPRVRASGPVREPAGLPEGMMAVDAALQYRPELEVAASETRALEAEADLVRRSLLAGTAITGGFKQQSDGQEGLFVGLSLPVPVFDRRDAAAAAAAAEVERSDSERALIRATIVREAALAEARLGSALRQRSLLDGGSLEEASELFDIVQVAYDEGEVGTRDVVDAADAFLEARLLESSVRSGLWLAAAELEHAIGGLPSGLPGAGPGGDR